MKKRTDQPTPAQLSLVGAEADTRTLAQKRSDNLRKAREAREAKRAAAKAEQGSTPTNLERFRAGQYPCSEWDDEEVAKGRPRGVAGEFGGQRPSMTGRQQAEAKRELLRRGQARFDELYTIAIDTLKEVAEGGEKDADRVKAALAIKEMVAGKVPERIEIKSSDPWQDILDDIMTDDVLPPVQQDSR
jgi:hypothetical protein